MTNTRDIINAARVAAVWLLVVSVFFGPLGLGGASAFAAASKTCGVSCPCDNAAHEDHADDNDGHAEADPCADETEAGGHEDGAPCDDECPDDCPDDCPDCSCCPGAVMAMVPFTVPAASLTSSSARMLAPPDAPASGVCTGVFRPPRSLT